MREVFTFSRFSKSPLKNWQLSKKLRNWEVLLQEILSFGNNQRRPSFFSLLESDNNWKLIWNSCFPLFSALDCKNCKGWDAKWQLEQTVIFDVVITCGTVFIWLWLILIPNKIIILSPFWFNTIFMLILKWLLKVKWLNLLNFIWSFTKKRTLISLTSVKSMKNIFNHQTNPFKLRMRYSLHHFFNQSVKKRQISILIIYSVKQWQLTTKMWNLRSRLDFIRILQLISLNPRQKGLFYSIWRNIFLTNVMINKLSLNYQNYYKISFNK